MGKPVRLANGVFEDEDQVGAVTIVLRRLEVEHYSDLALLCKFAAGAVERLPAGTVALANKFRLFEPDSLRFYDDVKDVMESLVILRQDSVQLKSSALSDDQSKLPSKLDD